MATVRIIDNILESSVKTFSVPGNMTVEALVRKYTTGESYSGTLVECYDADTGETFFAPIEDDTSTTNVIVQVNQKDVDLGYNIKEDDIVSVIITPAGGDWSWGGAIFGAFEGALSGALIGSWICPGIGTVIGGIIGGAAGFVIGGLAASFLMPKDNNGTGKSGLNSESLPDVRGAANQPLTDQPLPFVIGKHLATPFVVGSPWNEISGARGETNYIHCLYAVGYAPLRLTDFKLGEMFLAHNQGWSGHPALKNVFHGALSGIDEGNAEEIKSEYQNNTTIDLANRPLVDAATMRAAGWTEVEEGSVCTVYSSSYSNEPTNDKCVLVTPILDDGTVLSPAQLEEYANQILADEEIPVNILLATFTGSDCISQAEDYAEGLHLNQEAHYFGGGDGDIVNTWHANDIIIEILQQGQDGQAVSYGNVYPYAKIQQEIKANVLYIADGDLEDIDKDKQISYKGLGLKNGLRNNRIQFTEQFPHSVRVELDFGNGLYKTRSETDDDDSEVKYYRIPLWTAIQWRVCSEDNEATGGDKSGVFNDLNWVDDVIKDGKVVTPGHYASTKRSWHSFRQVNNISVSRYTLEARKNDIAEHTGNKLKNDKFVTKTQRMEAPSQYIDNVWAGYSEWEYVSGDQFVINPLQKDNYTISEIEHIPYAPIFTFSVSTDIRTESAVINEGWLNQEVFNFEPLGGTNSDKDGINEFRCVSEVNFVEWAEENLLTEEEKNLSGVARDKILTKKFKAYFYDGSNVTKSVEVRVVRISPCYLDETKSTKKHSAFKFNDVFTWTNLTSTMLDGDKLLKENVIVQKRPLDEEMMRKLCIVSLKAKTDNTDQLSNTLKKFTCTAQAFAPYYDDERRKWFPENVRNVTNYYSETGQLITKSEFEQDRQDGKKSVAKAAGNDFIRQMVNIIRTSSHLDDKGRYIIPNDDGTLRYCNNNVASGFLLAGIGPHLGFDSLEYSQSFYDSNHNLMENSFGDFNMTALAEWFKWAEKVSDGSTYNSDGFHYTHDGKRVSHREDELVEMYYTANAYIYQAQTLESLLSKICIAGRAIYTRDQKNRITVVIDRPEKYPVALINQQNTLKSSYTLSFTENPSGLQINFSDENDGYNTNTIYCMADGENAKNPRSAIEQYKFDFVTNNYQQYSLGRYLLANRILNKEIVTKTVGIEGASIGLGNLVILQDDLMLIGSNTGGRITKLIETERSIYGFIINNTYKYTGETEVVRDSENNPVIEDGEEKTQCTQGVIVMQPLQYQESRVITLRLAKPGTARIDGDGVVYTQRKGDTNIVIFETPISKNDDSTNGDTVFVYKPAVDNIVGFGLVKQIAATYRVVKIKQDAKRNYELTLMQYQEELYNYGRKLPSFQNNMTIPDRSGEDAFALSNNVTYADLVRALAESSTLAQGKIDETFGDKPPVPVLTANVREDCIQFISTVNVDEVNNIDHIEYEITRGDESTCTLDGSYSTEYYFDRRIDGFPEKSDLALWKFRARAVSIYLDDDGNRIVGDWSAYVWLSQDSLAAYGTWIPPKPVIGSFVASENGITASWICDLSRVYGSVQFEVVTYYDGAARTTPTGQQVVLTKNATYQFDRGVDGFPEKPDTVGMKTGTLTLDKYSVRVRVRNITSGKYDDAEPVSCSYSLYKTWIPSAPSISSRVSNRNITLYLSQGADCYGVVDYLVGVRRYDDPTDTFYVPDLDTNPYARESAYKLFDGENFVIGKAESDSQYSQTMPLETQGGQKGMLDTDESEEDNRVLSVPKRPGDEKVLLLSLGGFAPIDTAYQFEVYAFNKTVESFYDLQSSAGHNYDKDTYHKVSVERARKFVTALATSVMDVLNSSIISDKLADGAVSEVKIAENAVSEIKIQPLSISETKIQNDSISTRTIQAEAVTANEIKTRSIVAQNIAFNTITGNEIKVNSILADNIQSNTIKSRHIDANAVTTEKLYAYNMVSLNNGTHALSGFAAHPDTDAEFMDYVDTIKRNRSNTDKIDEYIRKHSCNYWIGLDTDTPEFYMGNVTVKNKGADDANYFHFYTEVMGDEKETNLDIKLSNFIVTAVSSTVKGFFNVRNKHGNIKYFGSNSFLQVNPESTASHEDTIKGYYDSTEGKFYEDEDKQVLIEPTESNIYEDITNPQFPVYYKWNGSSFAVTSLPTTTAETMVLKGDLKIGRKNFNNTDGILEVQGESFLIGGLSVGTSTGSLTGILAKVFGTFGVTENSTLLGDLTVGTSQSQKSVTVHGNLTADTQNILSSMLVGMSGNADDGITFQVGKSGNGNARNSQMYGTLSVTDRISADNGLVSQAIAMTLSSGIPSVQDASTTKIFRDALAFRGASNNAGWIRYNDGSLEIATGDDATEPIYVRQYNTSSQVARTATLLDGDGNTTFPGLLSANVLTATHLRIPSGPPQNPQVGDIWME